ncbi:MAG: S8 family peptidase [Proteobacteria bacterium]|nr:MAG: S8 family peptidase [Pseudomonadota bacterium]
MPNERYPHLFLLGRAQSQRFTSPSRVVNNETNSPARNRAIHAAYLQQRLNAAITQAEQQKTSSRSNRSGMYLDFTSEPGFDLTLKSLESQRSNIRLLNVKKEVVGGAPITRATVFVPFSKRGYFLKKINDYATETIGTSNTPKNTKLVENISDVRLSILESFWQDKRELLPGAAAIWVEIWLSSEDLNVIENFERLCRSIGISLGDGRITFPERTVLLILATRTNLITLIEASDSIAEMRVARAVVDFFLDETPRDQATWVEDLVNRAQFDNQENVAVLILDTGVNNGHLMLSPVMGDGDKHTIKEEWGVHDHKGHGTLMAGTAAYGDISEVLLSTEDFNISHVIESSKILPPHGGNPKQLWGDYTAQGISRAEIQASQRKRIICMAVATDPNGELGRPSSWSGKLDEVTSGYEDDTRRLMIVSAGNIEDSAEWQRYPESNITHEVHDPAQAWNALSIGAFTNKVLIQDPMWNGWTAVADAGGLSPFSSTSATWKNWPIKPEVLFEGGNLAKDAEGTMDTPGDLQLISTYHNTLVKQFAAFNHTSAATAQAAWMAAKIQVAYPSAWPETIRGLIVHSAEWTATQKRSFLSNQFKRSYARLLRICGYGVPNLERALYCAANSLTLIAQETLQPFDRHATDQNRYITRDMHLHRLPWPIDVLQDLGEIRVQMRITLSYFIEPSPGEIGWKDRYRYASHGLRFQLNSPGESEDEFVQRINRIAREDGEAPGTQSPSDHWVLGSGVRDVGSIHSDIWQGTASELANSHFIAVHPTIGWWRERHHLGKWAKQARYALLVSLHMPNQEVDIYTPVAVEIGIENPVPITIPIR